MSTKPDLAQLVGVYAPLLPDSLWHGSLLRGRSSELYPLYVKRSVGTHTPRTDTEHNFWEFATVRQGAGVLVTGNSEFSLRPETAYLISPGTTHSERSEQGIDLIWFAFSGADLPPAPAPEVRTVAGHAVSELIETAWITAQQHAPGSGHKLEGLLRLIIVEFESLLALRPKSGGIVDQVIRFLHEHLHEQIRIADLAAQFGSSEGHLQRTFKRATGRTIVSVLTRLRVEQAAHLLIHTASPIGELAERVGFRDPLYFGRVFRKAFEMSPSDFRRRRAEY